MAPTLQPRPSAGTASDGSGSVVFYAAALGSFCGTVAGGLLASRSHTGGLPGVSPLLFACIVLFAAAGVGGFIGAVWDDLIEGRLRGSLHDSHTGTLIVALVSSAVAALALIFDVPQLAVPLAVLAFMAPVLWLGAMVLWAVFRRKVLGR